MTGFLEKLARQMTAADQYRSIIPAGYTYLGQMISHDIVPPTQQESDSRNVRARLSLDSLYGSYGQRPSCYLIDGRFTNVVDRQWDVNRDDNGRALIPEPRNDENIIIVQLHRVWQKVHNRFFGLDRCADLARERTVLLFQAVIIEDYLQRILQPHIFDAYFRRGERHLAFSERMIAPEFARAAFRFGHSMVRPRYVLNDKNPAVGLSEIFRRGSPIAKEYQIDWSRFFHIDPKEPPQQAMRIDTAITKEMTAVTGAAAPPQNVVLRNLEAGVGLRTGAEYVAALLQGEDGLPRVNPCLHLHPIGNHRTSALGLPVKELPMLPYILLEAELTGNGQRLGVLGSLIVAETLQNAIQAAKPSVFTHGVYRAELVKNRLGSAGKYFFDAASVRGDRTDRAFDMRALFEFIDSQER